MSGKEAQVFLVVTPDGHERVAKIYKDAQNRSFKHRSGYTEGRGVKSSRDQRAMSKRSSYGKQKDEEAWRSAEVEMIHRLRDAGVRVPEPLHFVDGVLIMELIQSEDGRPAPRLGDAQLSLVEARAVFERLLREVVRMLCAGVVHGDLSDFNVLMGKDGPVVIDLPQAVDAARNPNAQALLIRDVDNLTTFLARFDPSARGKPYGQEIWHAYERAELTPDTPLTGTFKKVVGPTDVRGVLREIEAASDEEARRRRATQGLPRPPRAEPAPKPQPSPAKPAPTATPIRRARPKPNYL